VLLDPCRLARQVKEVASYPGATALPLDPCRLARQVKEVGG